MKTLTAAAFAALTIAMSTGVQAEEWRRNGEAKCPPTKPTGELSILRQAALAGDGRHWLASEPGFAAKHAAEMRGEAAWLRTLSEKSGPVRLYRNRQQRQVLVVAVCPAANCADQRAWVAYEPARGNYGVTVMEGRNLREVIPGAHNTTLAEHEAVIGDALQCAIQADS